MKAFLDHVASCSGIGPNLMSCWSVGRNTQMSVVKAFAAKVCNASTSKVAWEENINPQALAHDKGAKYNSSKKVHFS